MIAPIRLWQRLLKDTRGWYGGNIPVSNISYSGWPWWSTICRQASDNCPPTFHLNHSSKTLHRFPCTGLIFPTKWLDLLEMVLEAWLSIPILKESESDENFWGLQRMSERLSGDRERKAVLMTLGRWIRPWHLFPIREVCPIILGLRYILQLRLQLCFCVWWGLCRPEVSLISVSNLILDFIHSEIFMIDLIPLFRHLYFLKVFLAPSETTITVMVAPIIMMIMLRESDVINSDSRWALEMMRLRIKTPSLSQCPPLPNNFHSISSLLILDIMVAKAVTIGLVSGRW